MIRTSMQLKAKVRNLAQGDSAAAQTLIRNFIMEWFLERASLSEHRDMQNKVIWYWHLFYARG